MKKIFVLGAFLLTVGVVLPAPAHALSCIDPEGMIDYIVKDQNLVVLSGIPEEQKEHIKEAADKNDPNAAYNSGYTAQFLDVKNVYQGSSPDRQWVYFHRDGTWNYLCAGEPPKIGTENVYVINPGDSLFGLQGVVATYPVDSDMAKKLLKAIDATDNEVEPMIYEVSKADWLTRLHDELKDMAFIIKVKLAEWTSWKSTK